MVRPIDRLPPAPTGDPGRDGAEACEYLYYLREQLNAIITAMNKKEAEENGSNEA